MCQLKRHDKGEYIFPIPSFEPNQLDKAPLLDENANPLERENLPVVAIPSQVSIATAKAVRA